MEKKCYNTDLLMTYYNAILDLVTSYFGDKGIESWI